MSNKLIPVFRALYSVYWLYIHLTIGMFLQIGTLIYARVVKANSIMNPELSCMDGKFFSFQLNVHFPYIRTSEVWSTKFSSS
jgi:exosome complex RNA-binding protein Rrp4